VRAARRLGVPIALGVVCALVITAAARGELLGTASGLVLSSTEVTLADDDGGGTLFGLVGARPGNQNEGCVTVRSTSDAPVSVNLSAVATGELAPYVRLTITEGSGPSGEGTCDGFEPDTADHIGRGPGVIFVGRLAELADPGRPAVDAPDEEWPPGTSHSFRIRAEIVNDPAAQGREASGRLVWQAAAVPQTPAPATPTPRTPTPVQATPLRPQMPTRPAARARGPRAPLLTRTRPVVVTKRALAVRVVCPPGGRRCAGTLIARLPRAVPGPALRRSVGLAPGRRRIVRLALRRGVRGALRRLRPSARRRIKVRFVVAGTRREIALKRRAQISPTSPRASR